MSIKKAITWLITHPEISRYQISKATGISQVMLSRYLLGKTDVGKMSLDNAEKLYDYYKEVLLDLEQNYGAIEYRGKKLTILDEPTFTGRQLPEDQERDGYVEFSAPANDLDGNSYRVTWLLKGVDDKGRRIFDADNLDWSAPPVAVELVDNQ